MPETFNRKVTICNQDEFWDWGQDSRFTSLPSAKWRPNTNHIARKQIREKWRTSRTGNESPPAR